MVECIRVDKATLTKNIRKMLEIGYIKIVNDKNDRRIKRLYLTSKAIPAVQQIKKIHARFYHTLCAGISTQDLSLTEQILQHMVTNINQKVWHRMDDEHNGDK